MLAPDWLHGTPEKPVRRRGRLIPIALFLTTVVTTTIAGSQFGVSDPEGGLLRSVLSGIPFSFTLLGILGMHELGHYFASKAHRVRVEGPYFIPAPFGLGTLGAVIRIRSLFLDRKALIDVGMAGPAASFVLSSAAVAIGLKLSPIVPLEPRGPMIGFGDSIMTWLLGRLIVGEVPAGMVVQAHPAAIAGYFGLLVTAVNLFPVGQLDGGHIFYALLGRWHLLAGRIAAVALAGLATAAAVTAHFFGWFLWLAIVVYLMALRHPPPLDDVTQPELRRKILGWAVLGLFLLSFAPVPIVLINFKA